MSAPNFSFEHRCIVVTNDDFEMGNVPETEHISQGYTSYPQTLIPTDFTFFNVVLTSGYYEHACIDYEQKEIGWEDLLGYCYGGCPTTKSEFFADMKDMHGMTEYRLRKLCGGIKRENFEFDYQFADALCEAVGEWLRDQEEAKVNDYLDYLMDEYGYEEYVCCARFSNGEAWYEPKAKEGRRALLQAVSA